MTRSQRIIYQTLLQRPNAAISYEELAELSSYSVRATKTAVAQLVAAERLHVSKQYGERRNCYRVLPSTSTGPLPRHDLC